MQSYTSKPAQPVTVQAVQYEAPDADGNGGNADELVAIDGVRKQDPWNPAAGQNCLVTDAGVVLDRHYLVFDADGGLTVLAADDFADAYDGAPTEPAVADPVAAEKNARALSGRNTNQTPEA